MNTVLSVLVGIFIFFLIVIIHEGGHFFAAKLCGIPVNEFAIGMGPAIFKKQGKETLFTIRLLPVGGYCSMNEDEDIDDPNSFRNHAVWKKMIVIVAGAFMNLVLGLVMCFVFFVVSGKGVTTTIATFTMENALSNLSGLQLGDTILSVNGFSALTANDIIYELKNDEDGIVEMDVLRDGEKVHLDSVRFELIKDEETGAQTLIYDFKVYSEPVTIKNIVGYSFRKALYNARIVLISLRDIVKGKYGINDLSGPVGIVSVISKTTKEVGFDLSFMLEIGILITINVGIFNLLPLPALDGGRFVFLVIEAVRRKQIKAETEGTIHFVGIVVLMILMAVVTFKDITALFK